MSVVSTTDGRRIMVRFPYSRDTVNKVRSVPGARAHYEADTFDAWWLPLTMDTCRQLRKVFGADLLVSTALSDWARTEMAKESKLESLRAPTPAAAAYLLDRVEEEAPDLYKAMSDRPYQLGGAAFLGEAKQAVLADDPGLGKTLQTLGAVIQADCRTILVACRRTATRSVWERETLRWAPGITTFVAQGSRAEREHSMSSFTVHGTRVTDYPLRRMLIINIEMVRMVPEICPFGPLKKCPTEGETETHKHEKNVAEWPFLFNAAWDAIIFDESHNLLASTKNVQSKSITQARYGAVHLRRKLKPGGLAVALSGTPFRSKLPKAWGTLNWLRPDVFGSYWRFAEQHFGVEQGQWGKVVAKGAKAPEPLDIEAWDAMLRPYYLRRDKATAAPDLPPITYAGTPVSEDPSAPSYVQLDMDPKQAKAYKQMVLDAEADLEGGRITATGVLAELTRLRQFAGAYGRLAPDRKVIPSLPSNKIDWLLEFMQEREDSGIKVVVASSFSEMVHLAADTLRAEGFKCLTLTGETSDRDRAALVARFQDPRDENQVAVINSLAGGESITLDAADDMVFLDMPWTSDAAKQVEARIHRVSRIHKVTVYRLASVGTVDIMIAGLTDEQKQVLAAAEPKVLAKSIREYAS